jgi:hypothetical protein
VPGPLAPDGTFQRRSDARWFPRVTAGARIRLTPAFSVQPEVTWTRLTDGSEAMLLGLGFVAGAFKF